MLTVLTNVALKVLSRPLFMRTLVCELPHGTGWRSKHSSVSGSSAGQSLS